VNTEYDQKISELKKVIDESNRIMEESKQEFLNKSVPFLKDFFMSFAEKVAKADYENTNSLGDTNRLDDFKNQIRDLQSESENMIDKLVDTESVWYGWRKGNHHENGYHDLGSEIELAMAKAMWRIEVVLKRFNYMSPQKGMGSIPSLPSIPPEMDQSLKRFDEAKTDLQRAAEEIPRIQIEIQKKKASDLWDQ
jgi:chaperonin cofactor prefoldin|tara:strand:- start:8169 stop:8750 length:582 start_codon:yes stop_codon:yes gene_type:complete